MPFSLKIFVRVGQSSFSICWRVISDVQDNEDDSQHWHRTMVYRKDCLRMVGRAGSQWSQTVVGGASSTYLYLRTPPRRNDLRVRPGTAIVHQMLTATFIAYNCICSVIVPDFCLSALGGNHAGLDVVRWWQDALAPLRWLGALMHAQKLNRYWRDALPLNWGIHFSRACPFPRAL